MSVPGSVPRRAGQLGPAVAVLGKSTPRPKGRFLSRDPLAHRAAGERCRPEKKKPVGADPRTGFQVTLTQWYSCSSTSTVTWPSSVCRPALQLRRGQLANLPCGKSMVGGELEYVAWCDFCKLSFLRRSQSVCFLFSRGSW